MIVRTDLDLLGKRIRLPRGIEAATWTVLPVGSASDAIPGPTDTRLYAFLKPGSDGWAALSSAIGDERPPQQVVLPAEVSAALLPSDVLKGLRQEGGGSVVEGAAYDPASFNRGAYRGTYAIRVGDGLLVCLQTQ